MKTAFLYLNLCLGALGGPTSALAPLAAPAAGDLLNIVDVSDTTMAATGTNKAVTWANLFNGPTLIAPALGTPTSGNFSSGTFAWPPFNQNTPGYSSGLKSASTTVDVAASTAPSIGQILTATDSTHATWQTPATGGQAADAALTALAAGSDFVQFAGPASSVKVFTLPNAPATILTDNSVVSVVQGGSGRATGTTAYGLLAAGTTATGVQQTLAIGATTDLLVGGGASALPVWTAATGTGSPVRATSPTISGGTLSGSSTLNGPFSYGTSTTFSYSTGIAALHRAAMGIADVAIFNQTSASGTDGASIANTTWTKAPLNTTVADPSSAFTISGSVLTVTAAGAGRWIVRAEVPLQDYAAGLTAGKCRLRRTNNTATTLAVGRGHYYSSFYMATVSLVGSVTLAAGDTLELQGWVTAATGVFGKAVSSGESEVYSMIDFTKQ